jgi:hypothetical protein
MDGHEKFTLEIRGIEENDRCVKSQQEKTWDCRGPGVAFEGMKAWQALYSTKDFDFRACHQSDKAKSGKNDDKQDAMDGTNGNDAECRND